MGAVSPGAGVVGVQCYYRILVVWSIGALNPQQGLYFWGCCHLRRHG